jgi:NAD(P)-dependent dehydrogenase (short-subunit alcohol dehydrogenase family)
LNDIFEKFSLSGKVIVLTGSAGRVGSRFSDVLSEAGANVILVDIDDAKNKKLEKRLMKKYHVKPYAINCDITVESEVKDLVKKILQKYKKIDGLINNAHFAPREHPKKDAPFESYPFELWDYSVTVNHRGLFLCSQEIGKVMRKQKKGVIVNISSIYGITGPDQKIYDKSGLNSPPYYSFTKGGMVNFTRYLASFWHGKNIRVNTLTLGGIYDKKLHTNKKFVKNYAEKTMIGRMSTKEDYDGAILFLMSDASEYMTGANLIVDGGWSAW